MWYAGGFTASDGEQVWGPLGLFTVVFEGRAQTDFTIEGRWAVVRTAGNSFLGNEWRNKTWTIDLGSAPDATILTAPFEDLGAFEAQMLVKVSTDTVKP